jgi:hypothetical protein
VYRLELAAVTGWCLCLYVFHYYHYRCKQLFNACVTHLRKDGEMQRLVDASGFVHLANVHTKFMRRVFQECCVKKNKKGKNKGKKCAIM